MQIAEWLEKLGLGQYAERFVQNGVDMGVLPELMDEDFDKLGVLLGHRRKMLRAIADLDPAALIASPAPPHDAERRHLTVMFCDLVGSTALSGASRSRGYVGSDPGLSRCLREGHFRL
ncbi:class 3 adenylate cyclase [Bradyrhizobium diazoefficiens]